MPGGEAGPDGQASPGGDPDAGDTSSDELPATITSQSFDPNDSDNAMFIAEVEECPASAEMSLLALEKNPGDRAHLNEVFRGFHNIKGISGFVNLADFLPAVELTGGPEIAGESWPQEIAQRELPEQDCWGNCQRKSL